MSSVISYSSGAGVLDVRVTRFLEALARVHGKVSVRQESGGLHAYFPSPLRIPIDGRKELSAMHGAINLDKFFGLGKWDGRLGTYDTDDCAMCMKSSKRISAQELLDYPPLNERGIPDVVAKVSVTATDNLLKLVTDEFGRRVPGPPGDFTYLKDLPADHPAVQYVTSRGFSLAVLHDMLEVAFCHRELPEGQLQRFYRKGPAQWKDTPQNRLILFCRQDGSLQGWQARLLQYEHAGFSYFLHPYTHQWVGVEGVGPDGKKMIHPDYGDDWKRISRYRSADAMARNSSLFGIDAAVRWNERQTAANPQWVRQVVVCEGPLDAAKFGPPAVGMTGKFLSPEQARLLATRFSAATSLMDNDQGGAEAEDYFREALTFIPTRCMRPPVHRKDLGACSEAEIIHYRNLILGNHVN